MKRRLGVSFPVPTQKKAKGQAKGQAKGPRDPVHSLETFNMLWHGRARQEPRVPCINGERPPPVMRWKTERRRVEWWPRRMGDDQAGRWSSSDVKYKSSRISTDGHKSRGAGFIVDGRTVRYA